jgi:hypothetical protein
MTHSGNCNGLGERGKGGRGGTRACSTRSRYLGDVARSSSLSAGTRLPFTHGRQNLDDDQLNTVSCGRGKPMLEAGKKTPQIMRLLTKTQRRKHAERQGFWRCCDLVQPPMNLQDQTNKRSIPKHKKRNTVHVQQGNKGTLFTRVMIVSG